MTEDDILQKPMDKMAFESSKKLLLRGNNKVSATTLFDVADILLKLSAERDKNIELQKEVYNLLAMHSVNLTPKKELLKMFVSQTIAKHIGNVITKDLTLSRRMVASLFWKAKNLERLCGKYDRGTFTAWQMFEKTHKMLKEYLCKTR